MIRKGVLKKAPGIFQIAPCLPEKLVMGIGHIADLFFAIRTEILATLMGIVKE
jgi:hypothetical protein